MANELDQFEALDTTVPAPTVETSKKEEKKQLIQAYKTAMKETLEENPDYLERRRSLTDSVKVVNTLGFGDSGNIIVAESSTKGERKLQTVARIVGYKIQNIGKVAIPYTTEEFTKNAEGKWVGEKVKKTLEPGATTVLTRKYSTVLFANPEFNLKVENGKFIPPRQKKTSDIEALLPGYYFSFNDKSIKVNDDSVKLQIGEKRKTPAGTEKWFVKPEYETIFGYLNNSGAGKGRKKKSGPSFDPQDYAANFLQKLINDAGL